MAPFTQLDQQAGYEAMEKSLTPMQKALRKFGAGRPPVPPKNTPMAAVSLVIEQRERLLQKLQDSGLKNPRITSAAIVVRPTSEATPSALLVVEGRESEAVAFLERIAGRFVIVGPMFAVQDDSDKMPFALLIERTPGGQAALKAAMQRQQTPGAIAKPD
jgi:hypothetical protein